MELTETTSIPDRAFDLVRENGQWTINGQTWADVEGSAFTRVLANPATDDVEVWEFRNDSGGWHHPLHIHLVDFRILDRNGRPAAGPTSAVRRTSSTSARTSGSG